MNLWILKSFGAILPLNFLRETSVFRDILRFQYKSSIGTAYTHSLFITLLLLCFFITPSSAGADTSPLVTQIELQGNRKISNETVLARMQSREGEPFSKNTVQEDIKMLYSIGYFDDVRVEIDSFEGGVKLIYIFIEKPTIISLDFQGNKKLKTDDIKEKITITSGAIANQALITDNAQKIIAYYQAEGYWLASVVPVVREISDDAIALTFQIEEGPKVVIKKITIEGNRALSDRQIKKAMKTKKRWFFSFITGSGFYKKEEIKADLERIKELYHNNGYIQSAVSEPELSLSNNRKNLSVTITVSEGKQFSVGDFGIEGNTIFMTEKLSEQIELSTGKVFDRSALRKGIDNIIDLYMEKGYARADVNPMVTLNAEEQLANITLSITEGGIFHIGRIDISGNTKTRDKVIRREMRLDEGDTFNKKLLKRSYQRINNLNYFETVDVTPMPRAEEDIIDINVGVEEKLTGMLSIGGGYSSIDKFMVMGEITQTNLFGRGLYLKFRADLSSRRTNYNISLRDPWFMDKPVSASISLYNESLEFPDYNKKATGGSIGFGKELSEYVGANITYNLEEVEITDVAVTASSLIKDQIGKKVTSSISPSIWRDTRDNFLDPTTGSRYSLQGTVAGLGGDNKYYKVLADSGWYFPFLWETVFSARARVGYANGFGDNDLPLYERFYVGGINTVRGLGFGEGGPRNEFGEVIGGNKELIFNVEYIVPLIKDIRLKGVVFYDYGAAFNDDEDIGFNGMRKTTGFGFRWTSPFGPLRLEWGFNLDPKIGESDNKIEFSMGSVF